MKFHQVTTDCTMVLAAWILLGTASLGAQSRNTASAELRIRVVVVPSVRAPLPPNEKQLESAAGTSISFEMPHENRSIRSTADMFVVDPVTHKPQRAQLETTTIVAE
ncbi:MAG TPA: hypothetical protein VFQ00_04440 [Terriglobales bacterium]|nr:hypothetical protein [Terriglobales bacterium]